jgi:hypothetical protein
MRDVAPAFSPTIRKVLINGTRYRYEWINPPARDEICAVTGELLAGWVEEMNENQTEIDGLRAKLKLWEESCAQS